MNKDQFINYLKKAFPEHIRRQDHEQFDFVIGITPTLSEERESPLSGGGVQTRDSTHSTVSGPINFVLPNKKTTSNKFGKYLTNVYPEHIPGDDNHKQFDFVLGKTPTLSKKRELLSSGSGVLRGKSTNSRHSNIKIPVNSNTSSNQTLSSASNAKDTSFFSESLNRPINELRNIQENPNTPSEDTYNVLVLCSDPNENTSYNESLKLISKYNNFTNKTINTTFLNTISDTKQSPQNRQYNNYFDMIWFAGCSDIFNNKFRETVRRTCQILNTDGIVIFTKNDKEMSANDNRPMRVKNVKIRNFFLQYFEEIEESDTRFVFYSKKNLQNQFGPSPGDKRISSSSSAFFEPERWSTSSTTASSMSSSSFSRNREDPMKFSDFLDDEGVLTEDIKTQLRNIFKDPNWTVYNPPGDGFCTIHAIYKDLDKDTNDKDFLVNELYRAMKTYMEKTEHEEIVVRPDVKYHTIGEYNFSNQYTANETKENLQRYIQNNALPDDIQRYYNQKRENKNQTRIDIQELYNILKDSFQERTGPFGQKDTILIEDVENIPITKKDFQGQNIQITKNFLETLKNSNDLGTEIVEYFPYITGHNILYITVLQGLSTPQIHYYEGPRDSATPPKNTILFNCSGHTVLLQNTDEIKNALVKPYVPKFSAQQVNKAVRLLNRTSDFVQNMTRGEYDEIMN